MAGRRREPVSPFDVVIVGSGISGTLAAAVLGRAGHDVCLVDRHAVYPPDFRAEHLDGVQVDQLRRLGFLDDLTRNLYRGDSVALANSGRVLSVEPTENYGLGYEVLVNRARAAMPPNVGIVTERVVSVETSDDLQQIRTAGGRILTGRLLILATGQGYALCRQAGVARRMIRPAHSLTFGFDIKPVDNFTFKHSFLVYQRDRICDRIDYLAAFRMGAITRVNLFTYRDYRDAWSKDLLQDPDKKLAEALPGLSTVLGSYRTVGPVVARPIDLYASEGYRRGGVVLIGDAFQSSCPATGMGMVKLLTDIEQLCRMHVPRWLQTPGMGADKIAEFYNDPVKQAADAKALHDATYRRLVSTETSLRWQVHRLRVNVMERLKGLPSRIRSTPLSGELLPAEDARRIAMSAGAPIDDQGHGLSGTAASWRAIGFAGAASGA